MLIGVPNVGEAGGMEIRQRKEICVEFSLTSYDDDGRGWEIDEEQQTHASFITASMKGR